MLLAGISACLYGLKNGRKALSFFLFTRGLWLVIVELFIITLEWTFNPHYPSFILQVIWAFGISMMALSLLIYLPRPALLLVGIILVGAHNTLDFIHITGDNAPALLWSVLHDPNFSGFHFGPFHPIIGYPVLPWIGIITLGYCLGGLYAPTADPEIRKKVIAQPGSRGHLPFYRPSLDEYVWRRRALVGTEEFSVHTFLLCQYDKISALTSLYAHDPWPCPALPGLCGATVEQARFQRDSLRQGTHVLLPAAYPPDTCHGHPCGYAIGHTAADMVNLTTWVTANPQLKGYGFSLPIVYLVWIVVVVLLYPLCLRFSQYKQANQGNKKWLSYF